VCTKSRVTQSTDSLPEFIANVFRSLKDDNANLSNGMEQDNIKLSKELSERIKIMLG
jgi:hypothetical protein